MSTPADKIRATPGQMYFATVAQKVTHNFGSGGHHWVIGDDTRNVAVMNELPTEATTIETKIPLGWVSGGTPVVIDYDPATVRVHDH